MVEVVEEFAAAKINLALHILGRRADGYHELDSIVAFADVGDTLKIARAEKTSLEIDGPESASLPVANDNLILRAYELLSETVTLPPVSLKLTKRLPIASGIGGGSADAAAALRGLLKLAGRSLAPDAIQSIALKLGADVPVCLLGKACRMQGVGEVIMPLSAPPARAILLANPRLPCSTAEVFKTIGLAKGQTHLSVVDQNRANSWRNDMTDAAIAVQPEIAEVLKALSEIVPSNTVRMSGSGATCFALFEDSKSAATSAQHLRTRMPNWWIESAALR
jgi:4-diphosphocytidyl-2-C-methyl-D-erythritol kinase